MSKTIEIPTDNQIKDVIKSLRLDLDFFESLLKLNDKGREEALIYMYGLTHLKKYRKP